MKKEFFLQIKNDEIPTVNDLIKKCESEDLSVVSIVFEGSSPSLLIDYFISKSLDFKTIYNLIKTKKIKNPFLIKTDEDSKEIKFDFYYSFSWIRKNFNKDPLFSDLFKESFKEFAIKTSGWKTSDIKFVFDSFNHNNFESCGEDPVIFFLDQMEFVELYKTILDIGGKYKTEKFYEKILPVIIDNDEFLLEFYKHDMFLSHFDMKKNQYRAAINYKKIIEVCIKNNDLDYLKVIAKKVDISFVEKVLSNKKSPCMFLKQTNDLEMFKFLFDAGCFVLSPIKNEKKLSIFPNDFFIKKEITDFLFSKESFIEIVKDSVGYFDDIFAEIIFDSNYSYKNSDAYLIDKNSKKAYFLLSCFKNGIDLSSHIELDVFIKNSLYVKNDFKNYINENTDIIGLLDYIDLNDKKKFFSLFIDKAGITPSFNFFKTMKELGIFNVFDKNNINVFLCSREFTPLYENWIKSNVEDFDFNLFNEDGNPIWWDVLSKSVFIKNNININQKNKNGLNLFEDMLKNNIKHPLPFNIPLVFDDSFYKGDIDKNNIAHLLFSEECEINHAVKDSIFKMIFKYTNNKQMLFDLFTTNNSNNETPFFKLKNMPLVLSNSVLMSFISCDEVKIDFFKKISKTETVYDLFLKLANELKNDKIFIKTFEKKYLDYTLEKKLIDNNRIRIKI